MGFTAQIFDLQPCLFLAVGGWRLMVLTTDGRVRVWDVQLGKSTLEADAAPLLRGPAAVEGSCELGML
jgi:hypothetical protein